MELGAIRKSPPANSVYLIGHCALFLKIMNGEKLYYQSFTFKNQALKLDLSSSQKFPSYQQQFIGGTIEIATVRFLSNSFDVGEQTNEITDDQC